MNTTGPAAAYLLVARSTKTGDPLGMEIHSSPCPATDGPFRWEQAPKPYAVTHGPDFDAAYRAMARAIKTDPEPWPDDLSPHLREMLAAESEPLGEPYRRDATSSRARDIDAISEAIAMGVDAWTEDQIRRVAAALRGGR